MMVYNKQNTCFAISQLISSLGLQSVFTDILTLFINIVMINRCYDYDKRLVSLLICALNVVLHIHSFNSIQNGYLS